MLTLESLKRESTLQGLSDEQLNAIATLSKNDETATFGTKFAAIHSELDETVKSVTGKGKESNEKTSDYLKRILTEQKSGIDDLTAKLTTLEGEKAELEGKIAAGSGDKELIATQKATIEKLTKDYNTIKDSADALKGEYESKMADMKVTTAITSALSGIQFKEGINAQMLEVLKSQAIANVKASHPTYITDDKGAEKLIFKDDNGAEMRNPDNHLEHYTAQELLLKDLKSYGVVDEGEGGGGAGGRGSRGTSGTKNAIAGAKTRTEAYGLIEDYVLSQGMARGTFEFQQETDRIAAENSDLIGALPA